MAKIELRHVTKIYKTNTGEVKALKDVGLTVNDHEFLVLLGPSGCGKSTMLRVIAGLEQIEEGDVLFDDADVTELEPMKRNVSMVFQNYALYPHLNVYKNIAFPLKSLKLPADEIKRRVEETAKLLDIEHVLNRKPRLLSGGQRQRVALGRAMVRNPVVFLLDEPLSNLDAKMRMELRDQIIRLHEQLGTTFIYVTHDQSEAMHMGDRVVVMDEGTIVQSGTPQHVYNYPDNLYVAGFVGAPKMNFFATYLHRSEQGWYVSVMGTKLQIPQERLSVEQEGLFDGMKVVAGIRPEIFRPAESGEGQFRAQVRHIVPMGAGLHVEFDCGGQKFLSVLQNHADAAVGDTLPLTVDEWCVHVFDATTQKNLCKPVYKEEEQP